MRRRFALAVTVALLAGCSRPLPATTASPPVPEKPAPVADAPSDSPPRSGATSETPEAAARPEVRAEAAKPAPRRVPEVVRGIHLSGWFAGTRELSEELLAWAKQAGINTVVLDLKAEDGRLSWKSEIKLAEEIGANTAKIRDFPGFVQRLRDDGFWVVGRVVCFNDPYLYRAKPEYRIPGFDGQGYSFVKPMEKGVQDYLLEIARAAIAAGVDEIQFDYVRFSEKLVPGYNKDTTVEFRTGVINGFLKRAVAELKPLGAVVSADVFGLTTSVNEGDDMQIGQDYRQIAEIVDFISPMMYPSHYARGTYGLADPDKHPYETVKRSMEKALERTPNIPKEKHRPWIQDFTYPAPGYLKYTRAEVEGQIRALRELGVRSFLLWDPNNKYARSTNLKLGE